MIKPFSFLIAVIISMGFIGVLWGCDKNSQGAGGDPPDLDFLEVVDWSCAGYSGEIPDFFDNVIEVTEEGAVCDGSTDDYDVIQTAIDQAITPAVISLPSGVCRIESKLSMKSGIVLRGQGSNASTLTCMNASGCIDLPGSIGGDFVEITEGLEFGSNQLIVDDPAQFTAGGGAQLQQDDIVPASADWGENAVGQIVRILQIEDNRLIIDPPLHFPYAENRNPIIRPIKFIEQVGIEDLRLLREDSGENWGNNIDIRRAADSWVRRIESDNTEKYHIGLSESVKIEIRDSFFHHAKSRGDGGQGYGVSLARHATSVLVENNIFYETRHAMIVQIGTNGCVFGYNYSEHNYSDDGWDKSYISLHGHYPFMNLFEGNIVGWIYLGDFWGDIGPGNTVFRNRVLGTDRGEGFGDNRGITLRYFHGVQNIVGNEVTGGDIYFADDATGDPSLVLIHGNNVKGEITWDPNHDNQEVLPSYYLSGKPHFYGNLEWPSIGGDMTLGQGTIPALQRWESGEYVIQPMN